MIELIGELDGLAKREVARQDDVFSLERDDERALHGPRTYAGDGGEFCQQLIVGPRTQHVRVQAAVGQPLGEVAERADLPPRESCLAQLSGIDLQQFGGCGEMPVEKRLYAIKCSPGRCDG